MKGDRHLSINSDSRFYRNFLSVGTLKQKKYGKVCTITGPYYEELLTMPNLIHADKSHIVPNGYWKIIKIEN
ncbi:MAG: hypothetical protein MGG11_02850 [Trichodesmium sp. MAG_R03]|nr:hypothetical protein [Trichodesmium sp. MAG_R03]